MTNFGIQCKAVANALLKSEGSIAGGDGSLQDYMIERVFDFYIGSKVKALIPKMIELHDKCMELGIDSRENAVWIGDADVYIWYEHCKDENKRVLIVDNVVTCADNGTHIYMLRTFDFDGMPEGFNADLYTQFHAVNVQSHDEYEVVDETRRWGDHRDWKVATLKTYRDHDWNFGYCDGRDKNHSFIYTGVQEEVDKALWSYAKVNFAMSELTWAHRAICEEECFTKR